MTKCSGDRCVYIYMYICTLETYIHWRDGEYTNPFFALSSKGTEKKKKTTRKTNISLPWDFTILLGAKTKLVCYIVG